MTRSKISPSLTSSSTRCSSPGQTRSIRLFQPFHPSISICALSSSSAPCKTTTDRSQRKLKRYSSKRSTLGDILLSHLIVSIWPTRSSDSSIFKCLELTRAATTSSWSCSPRSSTFSRTYATTSLKFVVGRNSTAPRHNFRSERDAYLGGKCHTNLPSCRNNNLAPKLQRARHLDHGN